MWLLHLMKPPRHLNLNLLRPMQWDQWRMGGKMDGLLLYVFQIFGTFCLSGLDRTWTFEMKPSHSPKWISLSTSTLCTRWMDIRIEKYYNREYEYQSTNLLLVVGNHSSRCSVDRHSRKVAGKCIIYWTSWQCRCHKNGGRRHNWRIRHLPHSYNPVSTYIILS